MPQHCLALLPIDPSTPSLLDGDGRAFEAHHGASPGEAAEFLREVVRYTLDFLERVPRDPRWGGFLVADEEARTVVGMCGYKGDPNPAGEIEIAYGTVPAFEGRGYATAAAAELTRRALADPAVRTVIAHTLPERNASCRILEKNGFTFAAEAEDPEDGKVWRWERNRGSGDKTVSANYLNADQLGRGTPS